MIGMLISSRNRMKFERQNPYRPRTHSLPVNKPSFALPMFPYLSSLSNTYSAWSLRLPTVKGISGEENALRID